MKPENENSLRQIGVFITIPFVLALPPILGWLIGNWLDKKLNTEPYLMYIFVVLGLAAGFREVFRLIKKFGNW